MRKLLSMRSRSLVFALIDVILLVAAPVFMLATPVFSLVRSLILEVFAEPPEHQSTSKFSRALSLPKLTPFENLPRPRQMLAQMGHRANLA